MTSNQLELPAATRPPTQAVIVAGGRGTRLRPLTDDRPKAMVDVGGRPFLGHLLELLAGAGIGDVVLLTGYRADVIAEYVTDGNPWGLRVTPIATDPDEETSGRMLAARPVLASHFLFMYSDNYWPLQLPRLWDTYERVGEPAIVTVYRNQDRYTRDNVRVVGDHVVDYDPSRTKPDLSGVEIGYAILPRASVDLVDATDRPFEKVVYPKLVAAGRLAAHLTDHRYYSVGSLERLTTGASFFARRPAIILDRDGVLNRRPPKAEYVRRPEDVAWLSGSLEALRLLKRAGYRVIVVSNQAGVARGVMSADDLSRVEERMRVEIAAAGGDVERFYYCIHGWDDGCDCRKPRPGMLFQAQHDFDLDLTRTLFVGDDERDEQAADAAGMPFAMVDGQRSLLDVVRATLAEVHAA